MSTAAYDGIFLAPESIVVCPAIPAAALRAFERADAQAVGNDRALRAAVSSPGEPARETV